MKLESAIVVQADGTTIKIKPENGKTFSLEEMQDYLGGMVQLVAQDKDTIMLVNEEGEPLNLQLNRIASMVFAEWTKTPHAIILGPAVFAHQHQFE